MRLLMPILGMRLSLCWMLFVVVTSLLRRLVMRLLAMLLLVLLLRIPLAPRVMSCGDFRVRLTASVRGLVRP